MIWVKGRYSAACYSRTQKHKRSFNNNMNDDSRSLAGEIDYPTSTAPVNGTVEEFASPEIPEYLQDTYWWAYLHENSFWFFEREWVVNLILFGNMRKLSDQVLHETKLKPRSKVLQVACVYGKFSGRLADHLSMSGSSLDLVDVAEIQLKNAKRKLADHRNISYRHQDSSQLRYPDGHFDQSVVFFLLHEQPEEVRRKTIAEAIRVTRPGGKVVFIDYHAPRRSHPLRYLMKPVLHFLEPFALDLWRNKLESYMPAEIETAQVESELYFGGLYQKVVVTKQ